MIHGRLARAQKIQALSRVAPLNAARTAQARRPYLRWLRMERQTRRRRRISGLVKRNPMTIDSVVQPHKMSSAYGLLD